MKDNFDKSIELAIKEVEKRKILEENKKIPKALNLSPDQIKILGEKIQALPLEERTILMDKYIYKTGPKALEEVFGIKNPRSKLLLIKNNLNILMDLEKDTTIGEKSLEEACQLVLERELKDLEEIKSPKKEIKYSKEYKTKLKDLGIKPTKKTWKILKKVALVFLVITASFSLLLTSTQAREKIYTWLIEDFGKYSIFTAQSPAIEEEALEINDLKINYIPQGFELREVQEGKMDKIYHYTDYNENNLIIHFSKTMDEERAYYNTEDTKIEEIMISERNGYYWERNARKYLLLQQGGIEFFISGDISREEIIKIGENISK